MGSFGFFGLPVIFIASPLQGSGFEGLGVRVSARGFRGCVEGVHGVCWSFIGI